MTTSHMPSKLTLRAYQVGFGDCFLLTFHYPAEVGDRHVLVDFGSTKLPEDAPTGLMVRVARDIERVCGGKLHAVVATHRHKDHVSGFATAANKKGPGDVIAGLGPDLVVQPWTEHPDAATDATTPPAATALRKQFVATLASMHGVAEAAVREAQGLRGPRLARLREQLAFIGEDNISNRSAVDNLMAMGQDHEYVYAGVRSRLETLLPGVRVHVLGPPTLEQYPEVERQRHEDDEQFWHLQMRAGAAAAAAPALFGDASTRSEGSIPMLDRWFVEQVRAIRADQLLGIVRALDEAMNNTSVILLFEVEGKKLLFSGDAQIENWSYALFHAPDAERNCELLAGVDVYKVGHHGSLNATPKSLWELFKRKRSLEPERAMVSVCSTLAGKHGTEDNDTEVPRRTLVRALKKETRYVTTEGLAPESKLCRVIEIPLAE
jgi:L-ascorbate metabolism protein UlaG (beta-lactamase superfamily)